MVTIKITQKFTTLLVLLMLLLPGCGGFSDIVPAAEEAQVVDAVKNEEKTGSVVPADNRAEGDIILAEEPASSELVGGEAAPSLAEESDAEEGVVLLAEEKERDAELSKDESAAAPGADTGMIVGGSEGGSYASDGDDAAGGGVAADAPAEAPMLLPTPTASPMSTAVAALERSESDSEFRADAAADADDALAELEESDMADESMEAESLADESVIQQTEPLKAGEVDDNALWDDYLLYRRNYRGPRIHERDVSERYIIEVIDGQGRPLLGANVSVFLPGQESQEIYTSRTYANGQTLFHPLALDQAIGQIAQGDRFQVQVQKDDVLRQFNLTRFEAQSASTFTDHWTVTLDLEQRPQDSLNLDVLFLIDATGSMADEINKVQSTIFDVSARIDALPSQPNVRYGLVTYRDRGDSYVTNSHEFSPDVRDFAQNLNTVFADGGGDYPESLNEGLHDALHSVEWRGGETVQLIFLIADAPPHLDYAQDYDYAEEMDIAAQRGIKIFPIASSGLDDQGEYVFRQLAQYTQGRFIFLTYEGDANGGAPGETTTHHVDEADFSVENLDDLLVQLVEEELAYQSPQLARTQ